MKQTNNAIKFLMAQYRAIFKSAYVKGLATAVVLTSALAAGQAQAVNLPDGSNATDTTFKDAEVSGAMTFNKAPSASGSHYGNITFAKDGSLTIDGNTSNAAYLNLHGTMTMNESNTLTLNGKSASQTAAILNYEGGALVSNKGTIELKSGAAIHLNTININGGTLKVTGDSANTKWYKTTGLAAGYAGGSLNISNAAAVTLNDDAHMVISQDATMNITGKNTTVTLAASGSSGTGSFLRGTDNFAAETDTGVFSDNANSKIVISDGAKIIAAGTHSGNGIYAPDVEMQSGTKLEISDSALLTIDGDFINTADATGTAAAKKAAGQFVVNGADVSIGNDATLTIGNGKYTDNTATADVDESKLATTFDMQSGNLTGKGTLQVLGTAKLSKDVLDGFIDSGKIKTNSGSSVIELSDDESIDLAAYTYSGSAGAQFEIAALTTFKGKDLTVSKALTQDGSAVTDASSNIAIVADNLTLGSNNYSGSGSLGFSGADVQNINFLSNGTFKLANNINLKNITGVDTDVNGNINGDVELVSGAKVTVEGGNYTAHDSFGMVSGSLIVKGVTDHDSTLTLANSLTVDLSSGKSDIEVNGGLSDEYTGKDNQHLTMLDLTSGLEIKDINNQSNSFKVNVVSGGVVNVNADDLNTVLDSITKDGAVEFRVSDNGKLVVDGDLVLTYNDDNMLALDHSLKLGPNKTKAILEADSMTINLAFADYDPDKHGFIKEFGDIRLDELNVNNNSKANADDVRLIGGTFQIASAFNSNKPLILTTDSGNPTATAHVIFNTKDKAGAGSINVDSISVQADTHDITVKQGNWNASNTTFDLVKGSLTIEDDAALTTKGLKISGGSAVVGNGASLTVNGDKDIENTAGFELASNTLTINRGNLTLGSAIADTIKFNADNQVSGSGIAADAINLNGGMVKIDFTSGTKLDSTQLTNLKKHLFNGDTNGTIDGTLNIGGAQISGLDLGKKDDNGRYNFDNVAGVADVTTGGVTNDQLTNNAFTTKDGTNIAGTVGAIHVTNGNTASISNSAGFVNSSVNGGYFVSAVGTDGKDIAADISFNGSNLVLQNGGTAGKVTLNGSTGKESTLVVDSLAGTTKLDAIVGNDNSSVEIVSGNTEVANNVKTGDLSLNGNLTVGGDTTVTKDLSADVAENAQAPAISTDKLTVNGNTDFAGNITATGKATFGKNASATTYTYLGGNNSFADVDFNTATMLEHGTTTAEDVKLVADLEIIGNASLTADVVTAKTGSSIRVGEEKVESDPESQDAAGYLVANRLDLNGADLIVDPAYGSAASIVAVGSLGNGTTDLDKYDAGVLNGNAVALRNSILAIGVKNSEQDNVIGEIKDTFAKYLSDNGSLDRDNIGAIAYVAKNLNLVAGSQIIVDSERSFSQYDKDQAIYQNNIYLGKNSALAIGEGAAFNQNGKAAIEFADTGASIYAGAGSKIILTGNGFSVRDNINLFKDGDNDGIEVVGGTLYIETMNGLMHSSYKENTTVGDINLTLNKAKIDSSFNQASAPVKYTLISYAANDNNWEDQGDENYKEDQLHAGLAKGVEYKDGKFIDTTTGEIYNSKDYVAVTEGEKTVIYNAGGNSFLDAVVRDSTTGIEAETAARLGIFGGSVQAAMTAGTATSDAIAGRFGMGAQTAGMTYADNGQGAGLWVSPIYRNADSDGFAAQGADYGTDLNLYGVALGGDYTLANGLRVGAMFNIGSGDADGQGAGSLATNDFDYYGFAAFAGYTMGQFTVVGDISYTVVDNEVTANTAVDKIGANFDTSNLSVGVTGQYALNLNGLEVTPHAGLRFSSIDMDDYTVDGKDVVAAYNGDTMNVFSIPVGVTIAREFEGETWTVKPSFDLTLTGQFGDDEAEGTVEWAGFDNLRTNVTSEVFDNFTYGATVGVAARTGNFSLGFGLNYTGSSNVDEFGVNANARYVF